LVGVGMRAFPCQSSRIAVGLVGPARRPNQESLKA
jgi:hypothetical protein